VAHGLEDAACRAVETLRADGDPSRLFERDRPRSDPAILTDARRAGACLGRRKLRAMGLVQKAIEEEHHLEEIAKDGYAPSTMPIVLAGIMIALIVIVGVVLGIVLAAYYLF
jgi:hypothetical protein